MSEPGPLTPQHLAAMRREYRLSGIDEADLAPTWLEQLERWLGDAGTHGILEPNAMVLATAGADGAVSARTVLLKGLDAAGLTFFTNYESHKGRQLAENPQAAIVFPWHELQRQVHAEGPVERLTAGESDAYWTQRPRGSQIGSAASAQSRPLDARAELEAAVADLERRYEGAEVPRPEQWGGFRLCPRAVEFWQGREDRLHDRLRYVCSAEGAWTVRRLAP